MPMILNTKGAIVLPVPCSMPSRMMATPKNGSDTATMRSTVAPRAITAASMVNRLIMPGAKANNNPPDTTISATSMATSMRASWRMRFSSFAPRALPVSVAAAVCMP